MSSLFVSTALSRRDGSPADGIHLLWTAPPAAGYSVLGYDIQRRDSQYEPEVTCYTLTPEDLEKLHRDLRVDTPLGRVAVRRAACPEFPGQAPDEPYREDRPPPPPRRSIDFRAFRPGRGPNRRSEPGVELAVRDSQGNLLPHTEVVTWDRFTGLNCGHSLEIELAAPAKSAALALAFLARPARVEAFDADGQPVRPAGDRREPGQVQMVRFRGRAIARIVVTAPQNETLLLRLAFIPADFDPGRPSRLPQPAADLAADASAAPYAATAGVVARIAIVQPVCLAYEVDLGAPHQYVEISIGVPAVLAIAQRQGKAVDTRLLTSAGAVQQAIFERRSVDKVLLYVNRAARSLSICVDIVRSAEEEEKAWQDVPYLAKNIQLPLRQVNGALASDSDEDGLASSRLLAGESFDGSAFRDVADLMNETATRADLASPLWYTTLTRERVEDPFVELRGWPYALSLLLEAAWRRMLGFGYFDDGAGLVPGAAYDYRITGYFRRRDVEEQLYGFHNVPSGTTLPASFHLGPLLFHTFNPVPVELFPFGPGTALRQTGRKGIRLRPAGLGRSLSLTFPSPVSRVVLEFEATAGHDLKYEAKTSDYILGLSGSIFSNVVPNQPRVTLDFPEPIDTLILLGHSFLSGVRVVTSPPGADPEEIVPASVIIYAVRYEPTPAPDPPPFLGTQNLQQPVIPGDPALTTQAPPQSLGFRLLWLPPPPAGATGPVPWPPDLDMFPPFDVLGFQLERRRVDTADPFQEIDRDSPATLFFGNRGSRPDPPQLYPGIDLLNVFPDGLKPQPPVSALMEVDDVLTGLDQKGPPPGSLHQYRIFSVDAIGRRSSLPTAGSVVRLEKRLPPPQPVGPTSPPPAGATRPSGVRARVLQASDPNLTSVDIALLAASSNAIVLEWAWTQQERERDPYATEFRVYWQPIPPDQVQGQLVGPATLVSGLYEMTADLNQPVAANAMQGRYLRAGAYPFKVASHPAGQSITLRFEPATLVPTAVPAEAAFEFHPVLAGSELRASAWPERTAVVPITANENYLHVFRDRLTLDPAHPLARVWVGVSAADAQSYIPDQIPAAQPNGGRPGNESSVITVPVQARYLGRPVFTVPPPLPDVPEQVTDEPGLETVSVNLDLLALLPALTIPAGHQILVERLDVGQLVALVSARSDDRIGVALPDGTSTSYVLANPGDQAAFLAQIRTGTPGRIEGRFLMDLLLRHRPQLNRLWQRALPAPAPFGPVTDTLPAKAERYIHRLRLVDPAGHVSQGEAIVPQFVRVPSLRASAPPDIELPNSDDDTLTVSARVRDAFDLKWLILFTLAADAVDPLDERLLEKPQLLRLPNRRDLYPNDGLRLRLRDGTLLAPAQVVDVSTGTLQVPDRLLSVTLTPGFDKRVSVWAVAMTRDGLNSRFSGPRTAITGPLPPVVPTLTIVAAAGEDQASWGAIAGPSQVALERSTDGGSTWQRVTPWLPETTTSYTVPAVPGPRHYRLVLRGSRGNRVTGTPVTA